MGRERELSRTFVSLAETLIGEYEVQDFLQQLVDSCAELVGAAAVGVLMVGDEGELRLSAASTSDMAALEAFEIQGQEGPCYDAFVTGEQVSEDDLRKARERWPRFVPHAVELGYGTVHGFPIRVRDERLGALNVFFEPRGPFSETDQWALQALADVAAIGIDQHQSTSRRRVSQQAALVELGRLALQLVPLPRVYEQVCRTLVETFEAAGCQIHELRPTDELWPVAGEGRELPSRDREGGGEEPWERALDQRAPVVIDELSSDVRFGGSVLEGLGVVSAVSLVVPGSRGPFGTLSLYTDRGRRFDHEDVRFLGSVATLLGSVVTRRAAEARVRQAERSEVVGQLAAGIAHNFNNLLAVVQGNAHLLSMDLARQELDAIVTAVDHAQRLVRQLLSFSRPELAEVTSVDLNETVRSTTTMLDQLVGTSVTLELQLTDGLPSLEADASQLEQALVNLVLNARDAMPKGGTVTIRTREAPVDEPDQDADHHVRLVVSDTGEGMSDEVRSRAFDPFFTTKGPYLGTGLGLAAVYGAVTALDGRIDVDSELGKGTTVVIDLPTAARQVT